MNISSVDALQQNSQSKSVTFFLAQELPVGQGLLIHEVSWSHTTTHHNR